VERSKTDAVEVGKLMTEADKGEIDTNDGEETYIDRKTINQD
jgi:hypothetical protein